MQTSLGTPPAERSTAGGRFGLLLGGVYRQWRRQVDLSFKALGLSDATHMPLLVLLEGADPCMRQKDLARALHLDTSSLVRVLAQLRQQGYVAWDCTPDDRRAKCIALTAAGRELAARILETSLEIERLILADLSAEDLQVTRLTLGKISTRFDALGATHGQHDSGTDA